MSCKVARIIQTIRAAGSKARLRAGTVRRGVQSSFTAVGFALVFSGLVAGHAGAQQQPVKGEATLTGANGYARLVLKFKEDVITDAVVAGSVLIVRFEKPVDLPVDALPDALPSYIGMVRRDPDGTAIRLALSQNVKVNLMMAGERVFIDLLPEKWTGAPPPLPAEVVKELSERAIAAERALRLQKQADEAKKRPPIRVRASVQPTFTRLVFEMPDGVAVSSALSTNKFVLSFSSGLVFDLADAKVAMPANIRSIEQKMGDNASTIEIALIGEVDVRAFREEKNYIVDIGFEEAKAPPQGPRSQLPNVPAAPPSEKAAAKKASAIVPPTSEQIAREASLEKKPETTVPKTDVSEATPSDVKTPDVKSRAVNVEAKRDAAPDKPETKLEAKVAAEKSQSAPKVDKVVAAASAAQSAGAPPQASPQAKPVAEAEAPSAANSRPKLVPEVRRSSDDLRVTFSFPGPTPAAVFRRSDSIWLVFDTDKSIDPTPIQSQGGSLIAAAGTLELPKGRAVRIRLNRPQLVTLSGEEKSWTLMLADKAERPSQPLTAARNSADPKHANVTVAIAKPGQLHHIKDPDAGDALTVMTAGLPVRGFVKRQDFVEFSVLESMQGVVIQQNADDLTADIASSKLVLSRPGGLTLSSAMTMPERAIGAVRPIFDAGTWHENQTADFLSMRNSLLAAASQATGDKRMAAHIELARFYLSRGFYPEAKGVLDLILGETKESEVDPSAYILRAVATTLSGHPELALKDLANPAIGANSDSQLWKGLAYAKQGKWVDAREKFKNAEFAITGLPTDLQRIVTIEAFRAALEVKDYPTAGARSNDLTTLGAGPGQEGEIALLRGRLAEALGHDKDALSAYQAAIDSSNRPAAAEATLLNISLRQKRDMLNDDNAIHELEIASTIWRGDSIEVKNLGMLSQLYAAKERYSDAFAAGRTATLLEPNSEISRKVQDQTSALFDQLYNSPKGDDLPPVEALAMFYEYRDLTPIGRRGDELIRHLADRLVAVDLLDQAGELLQYQIDHRLEGAARAQVASRLAMVYLMNRKPGRAIAALRTTRIADLAGELRQQRLLLEARAQSDVGRHDLALDIVSNINGREAVRLRSDIYWAARRWRESSEQIELLYGDRWRDFQPLTSIEKGDIIRAAIGYALAEDTVGLARFREKYSAKMEGSDRAIFDIAAKPAAANSSDFARIAKMAAAIDTLDGFLHEMKARFPDAVARAKLPPAIKADPNPTGSLPEIVGLKQVNEARR
ncbi:tetratricopeptide repeat protein [Bradyrhizobium sp. SYSU BS000235]|uniref:tetratricopeptide repeat protein n=1 Tax=Bradyrhizobium sp. SYSU BS000235 TaxID=3411332 RepID=UPI003C71371F